MLPALRPPIRSLQQRLQSTVVLAVLAGYGLLLSANVGLSMLQRRQSHKQLVDQVLLEQDWRRHGLQHRLSLYPGVYRQPPRLEHNASGTYLVSITPLPPPLMAGRRQSLVLRQDVSDQVERERLTQLLLLLAAGGSTLFTSALLRPVLRKGLLEPLRQFSEQLESVPLPPETAEPVHVQQQPLELQSIARAFNALQQRMATSWEGERLFVDGVAHELRTPITLILGQAQSLLRHPVALMAREPALVHAGVQRIEAEAERMTTLISDLLDLARLDAGRLQLLRQSLDPEAALVQAYERLALVARGRLRLQISEPLPPAAADPDRLQQCLTALIDNALRYCPDLSPITLTAQATVSQVILQVIDQGPGVPEPERERIFERFARGQSALDTRGSGIGLAVVRLLMTAMGGTVTVLSGPAGGADFRLALPRATSVVRPDAA